MVADQLYPETSPDRKRIEETYETWLAAMFPGYAKYPLAKHHHRIWQWVWAMEIDSRPEALVAVINRGGAKSTTAELAVAALATRQTRKYALYICETQDQADDHVSNIGSMLEAETIEKFYPEVGERLVGKFGNAKGWRRNRLRTSSGFTIDALGLDTAGRGVKLEDQRPDLIILDDIDGKRDTMATTAKKIETITETLLPAGSENIAVLAVQNLIHADSIFAKLVDGSADFLRNRRVIGPVPGLIGFKYEEGPPLEPGGPPTYWIKEGTETWEGFDRKRAEHLLNLIGLRAFLREVQHEVFTVEGAIANEDELNATRVTEAPDIVFGSIRTLVFVDPAVSNTPSSDDTGITVTRLGNDRHRYLMHSEACKLPIDLWADLAVALAVRYGAGVIAYEPNQGGDAIESAIRHALERAGVTDIGIVPEPANKSKFDRAISLQDSIRQKRWHLVGFHPKLEQQIRTTTADMSGPSPDLLDSAVHAERILARGSAQTLDARSHAEQPITGDIMEKEW